MASHFRRWGAVYLLVILWAVSSLLFGAAKAVELTNEAAQHGQPFQWSEFWPAYWSGYFENLQSEWAQLAVQAAVVVAAARVLFRKSVEDMDRLEGKVDELLALWRSE